MKRLVLEEENGPLTRWAAKWAILFAIVGITSASLLTSIAVLIYVVRH